MGSKHTQPQPQQRTRVVSQATASHITNQVVKNPQRYSQGNQGIIQSNFIGNQNSMKVQKGPDPNSWLSNAKSQTYTQMNVSANEMVQANEPKEKIELFFSLLNTNSDPNSSYSISVALHTKNIQGIRDIGETSLKPGGERNINFDKTFIIDYYFEIKQTLVLSIKVNQLVVHKIETSIGKIMGAKGQLSTQEFDVSGFKGALSIHGVPVKNDDCNIKVTILPDFGNQTVKPYFIVKRNVATGNQVSWINAYKSEVLAQYPSHKNFLPFNLSIQFLCNGDYSKPILIEFFDYTTHRLIGGYCDRLESFINASIVNLSDQRGGVLSDKKIQIKSKVSKKYTFLEYIRGGVQINMAVGIDFTGSNGDPNTKSSLHSIHKRPNLYEKAIESCCSLVAFYDADQMFPTFGYGAIIDKSNVVNHCFPLNMTTDANIFSVQGIIDNYRKIITSIRLYGPTYFGPLIRASSNIAKREATKDNYCILLILTDGIINDIQDTTDAIVEASSLPLSIIIVGIGPGGDDGFSEMEFLDGDDEPLIDSNGRTCSRDIVQFVEFNKFGNDPTLLAEKVFEEVPRQFEDYFKMIEKPPGDPILLK